MPTRRTFLAASAGMLLSACGPGAGSQFPGRPVVVTSFYPIHSQVSTIAGDLLDVRAFLPHGQDPHLWEPTPRSMRQLAEADLLVANGANMEAWLPQVRDALPQLPVLVLSDYVELITYKGAAALGEFQFLAAVRLAPGATYRLVFGHTHERSLRAAFFTAETGTPQETLVGRGRKVMGDLGAPVSQRESVELIDGQCLKIDMGHESGEITFRVPSRGGEWYFASDRVSQEILSYRILDGDGAEVPMVPVIDGSSTGTDPITFDPHSWLSVINAKRYANAIQGTLSERYPEHDDIFRRNKFDLVRELTRIQGRYKEHFAQAQRREFVVSHNAFAYLARDFGLTQRSLQGLTTHEAPSLHSLIGAIRFVRDNDIRVVYHELHQTDPGIRTIVEEVDGEALPLSSMEYTSPDDKQFPNGFVGHLEMNLANLHVSLREK